MNGNHETMNVEGDFRYVDSGGFDECTAFLEYLNERNHNWEDAFVNWVTISEKYKEDHLKSRNYFGPWNLVEVLGPYVLLDTMFKKLTVKCLMFSDYNFAIIRIRTEAEGSSCTVSPPSTRRPACS